MPHKLSLVVVGLRPIRSYPHRQINRVRYSFKRLMAICMQSLAISGAKRVGTTLTGNALLQLNSTTRLGEVGSIIQMPPDKVIYREVQLSGEWDILESVFLSTGLLEMEQIQPDRNVYIDIGANSGLIARQTLLMSNTKSNLVLVEPVPRHIEALTHNLKPFRSLNSIEICEFALADDDEDAQIFTEGSNHGNSSLIESVVHGAGKISTVIKKRKTKDFVLDIQSRFDHYVIKCDTQGLDAQILSRIPQNIWGKTICAVVEVWSIREIEESDVNTCLQMWDDFDFLSWDSSQRIRVDIAEVSSFWLSKNGECRSLYLSRTSRL